MFSLIIVVISIALVAALALATLYFGGTAFSNSSDAARASAVVNQGQQLMGAMQMFHLDQGRWPDTLAELVADNYLKSIPSPVTARADFVSDAYAAVGEWTLPVAGVPTIELNSGVTVKVCREVNKKTRGDDGILKQAYSSLMTQCYGASEGGLTVVVTYAGEGLGTALPTGDLAAGVPPSDLTSSEWLTPPVTSVSAGGGSPGTGGDGTSDGGTGTTPSGDFSLHVMNVPPFTMGSVPFGSSPTTNVYAAVGVVNESGTVLTDALFAFTRTDGVWTLSNARMAPTGLCSATLAAGDQCEFGVVAAALSDPGEWTGILTATYTTPAGPVTKSASLDYALNAPADGFWGISSADAQEATSEYTSTGSYAIGVSNPSRTQSLAIQSVSVTGSSYLLYTDLCSASPLNSGGICGVVITLDSAAPAGTYEGDLSVTAVDHWVGSHTKSSHISITKN